MSELRMNAEEWRKIVEGLDHTPASQRDPHWHRARAALDAFLAPIVELRKKGGDPRRVMTDVACSFCSEPVTPGHNYVFEPSTGASSHTKCWLKERVA